MSGFDGDVVVFERTDQNDLIERQVRFQTNSRVLKSKLNSLLVRNTAVSYFFFH